MQKKDRSGLKDALCFSVKDHPCYILFLVFLMIFGITAGYVSMSPLMHLMGEQYLNDAIHPESFFSIRALLQSCLVNVLLFLLISLAGIWMPGILFTITGSFTKGFLIGSALFAYCYRLSFSGIIGALLCLFLPCLPMLILFLNIARKSLLEWMNRIRLRWKGNMPSISQMYLKGVLNDLKVCFLMIMIEYFTCSIGMYLFRLLFEKMQAG